MSMKKLRAFNRPSAISCNTSAKLEHECKVGTRVQITISARKLPKFRQSGPTVMFF